MDRTVDLTVVCVLGCSTGIWTKKVKVDFSTMEVLIWFQKNPCQDSKFQCITFHFIAICFSAVQSQVLNSSTNVYWAVVLSDMRSVSFCQS